ncbi:PREDICTED: GPI mannosyltransferase 3-like [Branchiostoma belcheri]|uniref:Mannosyltransferase n=1 Tax=Branchiostoma belcheri TaxID=7741 RepID=A0A6P4ZFY2_BRABE|nr:PREDICTED: GPI mannosyltransferase 3-like [Branchiostoma belcheri]
MSRYNLRSRRTLQPEPEEGLTPAREYKPPPGRDASASAGLAVETTPKERESSDTLLSIGDGLLFLVLLTGRLLNAAVVQTAHVPDEYWQSLEVAHNMVFGYGYLTWEWQAGLRGFTYPLVFASLYKLLAVLRLDSVTLLVFLPRLLQGLFTALCDLHLYKVTRKLHGKEVAQWTLLCQLLSWFMFYCGPRTLTNSMETVLTTAALYYYPWPQEPSTRVSSKQVVIYLSLAALSCLVRPTAAIMWLPLCGLHLVNCRNKLHTFTLHFIPVSGPKAGISPAPLQLSLTVVLFPGLWLQWLTPWLRVSTVALLLVTNLPLALYTSLVHQRGTVDVMSYLSQQADRQGQHMSVLFLMPCHSTPFYSHVHHNVSMRFLECPPDLERRPGYMDEADIFYQDPPAWLKTNYGPDVPLPTHVVMFNTLHQDVEDFLTEKKFSKCAEYFHTHIPLERRIGNYVQVYCLQAT